MWVPLSFVIFFILLNDFYDSFCLGVNVTSRFIEDSGTKTKIGHGEVSETQYATCQITTEEIAANAQATITRVLTGVCNAEMIEERFINLERTLRQELDEIKEKLNLLVSLKQNIDNHKNEEVHSIVDPRQEEVERLNGTIHQMFTLTGLATVFTYFLRIENFDDKILRRNSSGHIRSSTFYVSPGGYAMYLKVIPRDIHGDQVFVSIGSGVTVGHYDATLEWPFPLKHRVEILSHSVGGPAEDLSSQLSDPSSSRNSDLWRKPANSQSNPDNREWIGIRIPTSILLGDNRSGFSYALNSSTTVKYLWEGSLTVKLTVYL